jgi:hypothetical protein
MGKSRRCKYLKQLIYGTMNTISVLEHSPAFKENSIHVSVLIYFVHK